jgi:hypothetical protein
MDRFMGDRVAEIYQWRLAQGIEEHLSIAAHRLLNRLVAATSLQDVDTYGPVYDWANAPGRLGIQVEGKWYLTFIWVEGQGAFEIQLERR